MEEEPDARQYDDEDDDDDADEEDGDADEEVEVVLARCVENAGRESGYRRSGRKSTYSDANLARNLQEQENDAVCRFD